MSILSDYLKRNGIKSVDDLNSEEKATYAQWEQSLSGRQLTEGDTRDFLNRELETAINSLISKTLSEREDIFLKMKIDFIKKLNGFLDSPTKEKQMIANIINNTN